MVLRGFVGLYSDYTNLPIFTYFIFVVSGYGRASYLSCWWGNASEFVKECDSSTFVLHVLPRGQQVARRKFAIAGDNDCLSQKQAHYTHLFLYIYIYSINILNYVVFNLPWHLLAAPRRNLKFRKLKKYREVFPACVSAKNKTSKCITSRRGQI